MSFSQDKNQPFLKVDTLKYPTYSDLKINSIYGVQNKELDYYLKKSNKEYKMIYTYAYYCKPCLEFFPEILELQNDYKASLDVFYITDLYRYSGALKTLELANKLNMQSPILNIIVNADNENNKKRLFKRRIDKYEYFTQNIIPDVDYKSYGYSLVIIFDRHNNVLYSSTWKETDEEICEKIKALLK